MEGTTQCGCFVSGAVQMCPMHAAAPEMLDALESLLIAYDERVWMREWFEQARVLVAKAKGKGGA